MSIKNNQVVKIISTYCSLLIVSIILSLISKQPYRWVGVCTYSDGALHNLTYCFDFAHIALDIIFWFLIVFALFRFIKIFKKKK